MKSKRILMNRLSPGARFPLLTISKNPLILMIELNKWSIFIKNYLFSAILLANLRTAESNKGFKVYLLGQNLQLLAFIIIFWRIFVFWHVDQSDISILKNNNKWQMLFLSNSCHSPRSRQRWNTFTKFKKINKFGMVLEILCVLKVTHFFFQ